MRSLIRATRSRVAPADWKLHVACDIACERGESEAGAPDEPTSTQRLTEVLWCSLHARTAAASQVRAASTSLHTRRVSEPCFRRSSQFRSIVESTRERADAEMLMSALDAAERYRHANNSLQAAIQLTCLGTGAATDRHGAGWELKPPRHA